MPTRPILDQGSTSDAPEPSDQGVGMSVPPPSRFDSPLASQLPAWDLVPPHTMIERRRPIKRPANP